MFAAAAVKTNGAVSVQSLALLAKISGKTNRPAFGYRRVHELTDGRQDGGDGLIMSRELFIEPGFELREATG